MTTCDILVHVCADTRPMWKSHVEITCSFVHAGGPYPTTNDVNKISRR
jgi:hypothetical protein